MDALAPFQRTCASALAGATRDHPWVRMAPPTAARGVGATTVLKEVAKLTGGTYVGIKEAARTGPMGKEADGRGVHPRKPWENALATALEAWEQGAETIVLDDADLLTEHALMHDGEGFMRARHNEPQTVLLLKALHDAATNPPPNKRRAVCFYATSDQCLRFVSRPLVVELPKPDVNDYRFFLNAFLGTNKVNVDELFFQFPQLGPADLRTACVRDPTATSDAPWDTEAVVARVRDLMQGLGGALSVLDVEEVDPASFPGMQKVVDQLDVHVVSPFQDMVAAQEGSLASQTDAQRLHKAPEPAQGVILYGPPGTGKTTVCRYLAHRLKSKFFCFRESAFDGGGRWELHDVFARAEAAAPSVLFVDDVDVLFHRGKVAWGGQGDLFRFMLTKLDGIASQSIKDKGKYVCVIMACNDLRILPEALVRSGRIELWIKTERPNCKLRQQILGKWLAEEGGVLAEATDKAIKEVASETEKWTCADMRRIVKDARNYLAYEESKKRRIGDGDVADAPMSDAPSDAPASARADTLLRKAHKALDAMVTDVDFWKDARMAYT